MVGTQLSRQSSKSTKQKQENLVEHMKHLGAGWGNYSTKTTNARWLNSRQIQTPPSKIRKGSGKSRIKPCATSKIAAVLMRLRHVIPVVEILTVELTSAGEV